MYFFVLIQKSTKKNQGQMNASRPFVRPTHTNTLIVYKRTLLSNW